MRLIDADALLEHLNKNWYGDVTEEIKRAPTIKTYCYFCGQAEHGIKTRPTVNCKDCDGYEAGYSAGLKDAERPKGKWMFDSAGNMQCTNCNFALGNKLVKKIHPFVFSFCPDCGADMQSNKKETTFDDYLKEQLKDPEFRKEYEKLCDEDKQNCVTCDHFGKCEGCEKGEEE